MLHLFMMEGSHNKVSNMFKNERKHYLFVHIKIHSYKSWETPRWVVAIMFFYNVNKSWLLENWFALIDCIHNWKKCHKFRTRLLIYVRKFTFIYFKMPSWKYCITSTEVTGNSKIYLLISISWTFALFPGSYNYGR